MCSAPKSQSRSTPILLGWRRSFAGDYSPSAKSVSLVRFPQGLVDLLGQVSLLGIAELAGVQAPAGVVQTGERWLQVQLLGEIDRATHSFQRGVGSYPGLDDPVHFATAEDLQAVFPPTGDDHSALRLDSRRPRTFRSVSRPAGS